MTRRPHLASLGALLWLRNHFENASDKDRDRVLRRIDNLLTEYDVGVEDLKAFREEFPSSEDF